MRLSWTYKSGENIISIANKEKDLGVVIQDNLSPKKLINRIFGDTFRILRNTVLSPISREIGRHCRPQIQIRKIGIINHMVILVIFLPLFVHKYM